MPEKLLDCVEIEPETEAAASVVWLHGLGADGHDFEPIFPHLGLPLGHGVRFVFPHAPRIPVTINQGMVMRAWYDIAEVDLGRREDLEGIRRSRHQVEALLERERERGVPPERTVLAGFSQGGAVALFTGLRHPHRLAGICALSCYLVGESSLDEEAHAANAATPVLAAHGRFDPIVPFERGGSMQCALAARGHPVEWHHYPMQHQVCAEEIDAVGAWLNRVLRLD
jgi:phospholipase/carboxylesterase